MMVSDDKSVLFDDPVDQGGFTAIPNVVLVDTSLSCQARLCYATLRYFAWQDEDCWPGQEALAILMGCSDRTLRSYIAELVSEGWVRVERRGLGRTNRYVLTIPDRKPASGLDRKSASALDRKPASGPVEEDSIEEDTDKRKVASLEVRQVFDHWKVVMDHPRSKLDNNRKNKIAARLKDGFTVDDLKGAIDGCKHSPFHMGDNDQNKKYDDITLICRDASKVEFFASVEKPGGGFDWNNVLERN
jgi:hypothetical protein